MSLITYLTRIHFADRVLEDALPEELRRLRIRHPLILIDADGARGDGPDRLIDALPHGMSHSLMQLGASLPGVWADTEISDCDGVLGFGGPFALTQARLQAATRQCRMLALPTTTACIGVVPIHGAVLPDCVLCDPTLTTAQDARRTAETGMDALAHCVEAYLAAAWNPPADGIALEGVRRAARFLAPCVTDGRDPEARREMMAVALNAGLAAQKGLGAAEAMAHALDRATAQPARHGRWHAALLPAVLSFNSPAASARFAPLAEALGLQPGSDIAEALGALGAALGLPRRLVASGLDQAALAAAADHAAAEPASRTNPRHATASDYLVLLSGAM